MTKNNLAVLWLIFALVALSARHTSAQEWQRYQLTHYEGAGSLGNSGCVADSFGNLHHYFICSEAPQGNYRPLYYMRTDFYGHVLTDTIRVNGFAGPYPVPSHANVVGDGSHSWCVFTDRDPHDGGMYLYMTERDSAGNEVFAPRQLGPGSGGNARDHDLSSVLDTFGGLIHVCSIGTFPYSRFTTSGDVQILRRPLDGDPPDPLYPAMTICPADGRPWASFRIGTEWDLHILLARFGEDTSQTIYHALANSAVWWIPGNLGMDSHRCAHIFASCDTSLSIYIKLDSTFQNIEDYLSTHLIHSIYETYWQFLKTDEAGNTIIFLTTDTPAIRGLWWGYRRADGVWTHPFSRIDPDMQVSTLNVVAMDSEKFAFTMSSFATMTSAYAQLYLYTYGFPPDTTQDVIVHNRPAIPQALCLTVHPNPFNSSARIGFDLPQSGPVTLEVFDETGRHARTLLDTRQEAGHHEIVFKGDGLASGTYFVRLRAGNLARSQKLVLMK